MAASRDIPSNRSASQQRQGLGSAASSLPSRQSYLRTHSHSVSSGSNPSSRVNRRKSSVQVSQANIAALTAALKESTSLAPTDAGLGQAEGTMVSHSPKDKISSGSVGHTGSVLVDGPVLSTMLSSAKAANKSRTRRASEGSRVSKDRPKSTGGELRCETCGKGYKHGSCLTKHLWEHTPEWALTSKLLISKHQQVQLLEAASVLVQMNANNVSVLPQFLQHDDEPSSDSPAASGSSDPIDEDDASSRTSTPSQDEMSKLGRYRELERRDSFADSFAHSYQSSTFGASVPNDSNGVPLYRPWSSSYRTSYLNEQSDDEQIDTKVQAHKNSGTSAGIPPVPPLPAKYAKVGISTDVDMADDDDDDDGVFGHMEQ